MSQLMKERRTVLRRWLREARMDHREAAALIGYDTDYMCKLISGRRPINDKTAWRLRYRLGVPMDAVEPPAVPLPH